MTGPSFRTKIFLSVLRRAKDGRVAITFPDGKSETFGEGGALIEVKVKNWEAFDLMFSKGDLGLAEAIIEGEVEVSDVAALIEWACRNDSALGQSVYGTWYGTFLAKLKNLLAANTKAGARRNIMAHYDLGNEFYRLWLDPSMTYSSALFGGGGAAGSESLQDAQMKKYDRIIDELGIKGGDRVLEIGCGWGGFFSRAVEKTGCEVTAVMNSPSQARHNEGQIAKRGMTGQVKLKQQDYREIEGKFDKVVSIEMIEAVGERYWGQFFGKIAQSLKPGGQALIQGITIREDLFYSYRSGTDFIQQYVFPGGMLLTNRVFAEQGAAQGMRLANSFEFAESYAATLKEWRENFNRALADVKLMGFDDRFIRLWNLYLGYCEGAFRAGRISVGQFHFAV